jgi:hypothetical protein
MAREDTCPSGVRPDPRKCGMGQGADCCIYLLMHPDEGFECGRGGVLAQTVELRAASGKMSAQRRPVKPYPVCQTEGWTAGGLTTSTAGD